MIILQAGYIVLELTEALLDQLDTSMPVYFHAHECKWGCVNLH